MQGEQKKLLKNTSMLYVMNIAKLVIPLLTLPYLTRVLSKDGYGAVSYVKAVMQYMQVIVDFGFLLSATRDIVNARGDKMKISEVVGDTLAAKFILVLGALMVLVCMIFAIPILRANVLLTLMSFVTVCLTCLLMDFLFRGIEEMQVITYRYVLMRGISALLTFVFVKGDADILWIPVLDILGSVIAIGLVLLEMKKRGYGIRITGIRSACRKLKESFVFFLSNMASTTFTALNTLMIGIYIDAEDVANWSLCLQMVSAIQAMYTPITDGIYPHMVKKQDLGLIKRTAKIIMPLIGVGCTLTFVAAKYALIIVGGVKYIDAVPLLRAFVPLLFFSFPAMLLGWPALGAINKAKETTKTTMITAILQIVGMVILLFVGQFTVLNLAVLRGITEACMFGMRFRYVYKFKGEFIG